MNQLLLGPFTEADRTKFINESCLVYMFTHPTVPPAYARKLARSAWRNKVYRAISEKSNCI